VWLDALFAEADAIETANERGLWLLGAFGFLTNRLIDRAVSTFTWMSFVCFTATAVFGVMAVTEYEGLLLDDDWYPALALAAVLTLIGVSLANLRRRQGVRP
jgi:hypothetical protein